MNEKYYFKNNEFVIEDYDIQKPFASFLPGIAGKKGIPLWCHYVNRAQAITSFGLCDKNGSILEFYPANTAYRLIDKMGYRTFVKINGVTSEIFSPNTVGVKRTMYIKAGSIRIEEINAQLALKVEVTYYGLPEEHVAGLVRMVKVTNLGDVRDIIVVDGITQLLSAGTNEWMLKHQSNLLKSWLDVKLLPSNIAYYVVNSVPADEAEVNETDAGNYYLSIVDGKIVKPIYDANVVFGADTSLCRARMLEELDYHDFVAQTCVPADKVGVGFTPCQKRLAPNEELAITTLIGNVQHHRLIEELAPKCLQKDYFSAKLARSSAILDEMLQDVTTKSKYPLFDNYMKQNYLDNILRGGYPMFFKQAASSEALVYHLFSRRHGDMEREYNFFSIAPEYYSQGNGNFRDVCQNRRSDVLFHPEVGIYNAKVFANLIQLDGYNPLGVLGSSFVLKDASQIQALVAKHFDDPNHLIEAILTKPFTPGMIVNAIENNGIKVKSTEEVMLAEILAGANQEINADFGEGYWSDHWTYILDLIENTLSIHPEKEKTYLYDDYSYRYYESPVYVLPRSEKYVVNKRGKVRQYGAIIERDEEKINRLHLAPGQSNWSKLPNGADMTTNLYGKLFLLAFNKYANLDRDGMGIEMEANKPGWNDAMNGVPGLFGSGLSETIELARLVKFLIQTISKSQTRLPQEFWQMVSAVAEATKEPLSDAERFEKVATLKEAYRANVRFGCQSEVNVQVEQLLPILLKMQETLDLGLQKAFKLGQGIIPSYLIREANEFTTTDKMSHYGLPIAAVKSFTMESLPAFLEAPARSFKYINDQKQLQTMYQAIKKTALYDARLKMYKTSVDLDDWGYEIGRVRAFQKGWLERESNFLHMTYKYLLGLLKAGLYEEYYAEIQDNFVCFMDPVRYGRSTLENSSFIAPSNNPDPAVWGEGFVARLSGSTAEMLSMWFIMMFGEKPFALENGELVLSFKPKLAATFFDENDQVSANFLSNIKVTYHNPKHLNLYEAGTISQIVLHKDGQKQVIMGDMIKGDLAKAVRASEYQAIDIEII